MTELDARSLALGKPISRQMAAEVLDANRSVTGWLMKDNTTEAGQ